LKERKKRKNKIKITCFLNVHAKHALLLHKEFFNPNGLAQMQLLEFFFGKPGAHGRLHPTSLLSSSLSSSALFIQRLSVDLTTGSHT
jgi:hypothetical protein